MENVLFLIGRIIVGGFFLMNAYYHLTKTSQMAEMAAAKGVPMSDGVVIATGIQILLGGLSVVLGFYPLIGVWLLIIFLVMTAVIMHNYWAEKSENTKAIQKTNFMKNIALAACLLMISTIHEWPISLGG